MAAEAAPAQLAVAHKLYTAAAGAEEHDDVISRTFGTTVRMQLQAPWLQAITASR